MLKQPLAGVYLSFFVMVTLLILVGSTWMGLYLAKRITRPVQMLSVAAQRDRRRAITITASSTRRSDEFGSMVEAFNAMAAELASSRRRLERASVDLERKNQEVEGRRRYIETILERDRHRRRVDRSRPAASAPINPAALRLLELDADSRSAAPRVDVFARPDLQPINDVLDQAARAQDRFASRRKSRWSATAASGTWPRRRRAWPAPTAASTAPCWCSTT